MKKLLVIAIVLFTSNGFSQDVTTFFEKTDAFFKMHVLNGKVNYSQIHSDQNDLNALMLLASKIKVSEQDANTYQTFWINAYNLSVIKGIIDNYPTKSPLDTAGFFDKITYDLGSKQITLNDIENKMLRAKFNDARIHFVLVCGAVGCPPLISEAYLPNTLNSQMDTQTKKALNGNFLKVNAKKERVEGSEILKWYKDDFTQNGQSEIDFINTYRTEKIPKTYKLIYFTYNWNLNKQ